MEETNIALCVVELFACQDTLAAFIPYFKTHPQVSRPWCVEMQIQAVLVDELRWAAQRDAIHMEKWH